MNRKGIAPIIAFVMLMALAIALGTFVTVWYTRATESQTSAALEKYATGEECNEVKFDIAFKAGDCCWAEVYNLGSFKIDSIKVDKYFGSVMKSEIWNTEKGSPLCSEGGLYPKAGCAIPLNGTSPLTLTKIQISPLLKKGGEFVQCMNDKEFTVPAELPEGEDECQSKYSGCLAG